MEPHFVRARLFVASRNYRKCDYLKRRLSGNAVTDRASRAMNLLGKTKMQNQWKILSLLREYLNKTNSNKNIQIVLSKEWIEALQKMTYTQVKSLREFIASGQHLISGNAKENKEDSKSITDGGLTKSTMISPTEKERILHEIKKLEQIKEQSSVAAASAQSQVKPVEIKDEQGYPSFSQSLSALLPKLKFRGIPVERSIAKLPKWKTLPTVSKNSIISRTKHVLNSIETAESNASRWRRIEDLLQHVDQYPEARHHAIKGGGVQTLLRARLKSRDESIQASVREALAVLGYIEPLPGRGIRILSIDGGGMRGLLVIEMMKRMEQLTGKKIHEMFDYICGVSTGAILAAVLALPNDIGQGGHKRKSLEDISNLYKELSLKVFSQNTFRGTSSLVWSHAYYDTSLWEQLLQEQLGDKDLIKTTRDRNSPKFSAVSAVVNHAQVMAYVFRNYTLPHRVESQYMGSYKHKLWEAVRASAAAPVYFEEFKGGEYLHQDGGIMVNNPCAVAIHEAQHLWPNNEIQCVVSFGTGRIPFNVSENEEAKETAAVSSWKEKFFKILDSATDTEAVHTILNDLLPDKKYYRFNPYLTEMLSMSETRPEKIAQLEQDAIMYMRKNDERFQEAAKALMQKRTPLQKLNDYVEFKKTLYNV